MLKRISLLCMAILISIQLVACGSGSVATNEKVCIEDDYATSDSLGKDYDYESPSMGAPTTDSVISTENDLEERKIIKNASISFETKEFDGFIAALYSCISEHSGYVQSQDTRGSGAYDTYSQRYSNFTIRIPENRYESFISNVGNIGSVTYISEYQNDVTMNYIDIESHIGALQAEYNALISILEKSTNINDIITVQSRISEINYQLDSLRSQLRKYDDLISYCTVNLSVKEVKRETPKTAEMTFGEKISSGLSETFADIGEDLTVFAIWFVVSLPYFVIWGVIIAGSVLVISSISKKKKRSKLKKEKALDNNEETKKD